MMRQSDAPRSRRLLAGRRAAAGAHRVRVQAVSGSELRAVLDARAGVSATERCRRPNSEVQGTARRCAATRARPVEDQTTAPADPGKFGPAKPLSQKKRAQRSLGEQLQCAGISPEIEYFFCPRDERGRPYRRWRFDFAIPAALLAIEVDGGMFAGGRHGGQPSVVRDLEKLNAAAMLGWRILRVTPAMVRRGEALRVVLAAIGQGEIPL